MRYASILFLFVLTLGSAAHATGYAAVAYSIGNGVGGASYGSPSSRGFAESLAVANCGTAGCTPVGWVRNGCVAVAGGYPTFIYGYGYSHTSLWNAESRALAECARRGPYCHLVTFACGW